MVLVDYFDHPSVYQDYTFSYITNSYGQLYRMFFLFLQGTWSASLLCLGDMRVLGRIGCSERFRFLGRRKRFRQRLHGSFHDRIN